jgi:hypothetical protein
MPFKEVWGRCLLSVLETFSPTLLNKDGNINKSLLSKEMD